MAWLGPGETGIPTPKPDLHQMKIMMCVWWGINGIIHWELMPANTTITAQVYCNQLDRVAEKLCKKQKKVFFLHDNARPHVASKTHKKLLKLGWTVLPHPAYSPDLSPTDYHLFRSLAHYLTDKQFNNKAHLKQELDAFFNHKSPEFYRKGIMTLPERWRKVINNNGGYILDT
jgi:histone-lysine N-methyltransferase SETMAR